MASHLFLDTSFLLGISLNGLMARVLSDLVETAAVKIHVPRLVEREFAAGVARQCDGDSLKAAANATRFLDGLRVVRHEIAPSHANEVFDLYFAGSPPFKKARNRNDLPDAFIFVAIRDSALTTQDRVHVIVPDNMLAQACATIPKVTIHSKLSGFVHDVSPGLSDVAMRPVCQAREEELEQMIEDRLGKALGGRELDVQWLPSADKTAILGGDGKVHSVTLDMADAEAVAPDALLIPFGAEVRQCRLDSFDERQQVFLQTRVDAQVEGNIVVEVKWEKEGSLGELDLEIVDVDLDGGVKTEANSRGVLKAQTRSPAP